MKLGLFSVLAVIVLASVSFALGDSCLDTCVNAPTGYDIDCACQAGCGQDNSGEFANCSCGNGGAPDSWVSKYNNNLLARARAEGTDAASIQLYNSRDMPSCFSLCFDACPGEYNLQRRQCFISCVCSVGCPGPNQRCYCYENKN